MESVQYLKSARQQFEYYKLLGEKTFAQLPDHRLFTQINETSNSVATIVKHLHGNMVSRWTDFMTTDGEKSWRNRDAEFDNDISTREEMMQRWNEGWQCLFKSMDEINEQNFDTIIYIRNQGHSITDAINRQLCHYAYHIGQIVFAAKIFCDDAWSTLSIAKGKSQEYNSAKFSKPKHKEHFTAEYIKQHKETKK